MIEIVPILNRQENFNFRVPVNISGVEYINQVVSIPEKTTIAGVEVNTSELAKSKHLAQTSFEEKVYGENTFLFTPVRHEYLMKIDGKKFTFQSISEMQKYIYNSNHSDYSFRGIIFFCGFFVEEKFECDNILDLNKEVKFILKSDKINCSTPSKNNKRFFTSRIRNWINVQNLTDSTPIWCNVEGFQLPNVNLIINDEIPELELISIPENVVQLDELNKLPENNKPTLFERLRKLLGIN